MRVLGTLALLCSLILAVDSRHSAGSCELKKDEHDTTSLLQLGNMVTSGSNRSGKNAVGSDGGEKVQNNFYNSKHNESHVNVLQHRSLLSRRLAKVDCGGIPDLAKSAASAVGSAASSAASAVGSGVQKAAQSAIGCNSHSADISKWQKNKATAQKNVALATAKYTSAAQSMQKAQSEMAQAVQIEAEMQSLQQAQTNMDAAWASAMARSNNVKISSSPLSITLG